MKTEVVGGFPDGLPPGGYEVEMLGVVYRKNGEPVLRLRFKPQPEPEPKPETTFLLVEVLSHKGSAAESETHIAGLPGVVSVTVHNDEHPHGCCCQHCPHDGNCRD